MIIEIGDVESETVKKAKPCPALDRSSTHSHHTA
jgi:hypothetical protein